MNKAVFLFMWLILAAACNPKASNEAESGARNDDLADMEAQVLAVHDEVMPRMSDINRLSSQLRKIKESAGQTAEGQPATIEGLDETLLALRNGEQSMMDWMKNYGEAKANVSADGLKAFYLSELEKIKKVKEDMLSSIDAANAWLATHPAG